jgi:hypothetical protein
MNSSLRVAVARVRKAVVAALSTVIVAGVHRWLDIDAGTVAVLVDAAVVSLVVWAVPNAKDVLDA